VYARARTHTNGNQYTNNKLSIRYNTCIDAYEDQYSSCPQHSDQHNNCNFTSLVQDALININGTPNLLYYKYTYWAFIYKIKLRICTFSGHSSESSHCGLQVVPSCSLVNGSYVSTYYTTQCHSTNYIFS
jgi:hypothetical protein